MREDTSSKLSNPIVYEGYDYDDQLKEAMQFFYDQFLDKSIKPSYNGRFIFFDMSKKHDMYELPYPVRFLHITSIDDEEKYNMYPCVNDRSFELCNNRCTGDSNYNYYVVLKRWECPYRLSRIHWVREVIDLANKGDPNITEWEVVEYGNDRGKYRKRLIRYTCGIDDYLVVLKVEKKQYKFMTAYPIVTKSKKLECDTGYRNYIKK